VFERIDLLDDISIVPELMQLVAHTSTTRVVLQRWKEGDVSARSRVSYPDGLLAWAQGAFLKAKKQQAALLGTRKEVAGLAGAAAAGAGGGGTLGGSSGTTTGGVGGSETLVVPTHPRQLRSRL
jgi:hypothetical protein